MLRPVSFTYKHDIQQHTEYGLIAEEVHESMPELVAHDNDGNIYTVRYQLLPPLLLAALQQQEKVLVDLERQLAVLKHELNN